MLHAKNECRHCDAHPEWQELRRAWGIAFTGQSKGTITPPILFGSDGRRFRYEVIVDRDRHTAPLPCPADFNRPPFAPSDHRRWAGNVATSQEPVNETPASQMVYPRPPPPTRPDPSLTEKRGAAPPRRSCPYRYFLPVAEDDSREAFLHRSNACDCPRRAAGRMGLSGNAHVDLRERVEEVRGDVTFMARLRRNVRKHRDLLDRLR